MSFDFPWSTVSYRSKRLSPDEGDAAVEDRQDRLSGFSTTALAGTHVLLIGAGGLGSHVACGLARKGANISIVDYDTCEVSNLHRQTFVAEDVGRSKALCLAKHAAAAGFLGSRCVGHEVAFCADTAATLLAGVKVCVCGVDNNESRRTASLECGQQKIPCLHLAVSEDAEFGWLFVEEISESAGCVGCVFPRVAASADGRQPCREVPAVLDILLCLAGLTLRRVDSLVMPGRRVWWNYRDVHLLGGSSESFVAPRPGCPLCGVRERRS